MPTEAPLREKGSHGNVDRAALCNRDRYSGSRIHTAVRHIDLTSGQTGEKRRAAPRCSVGGMSRQAREQLVCENLPLVHRIARRFCGRGTDYDDLCQIGAVGMMRAIDGFDLSLGTAFSTYAVPLIIGEIKRHLRDDGPIKVGRGLRRLGGILMRERELYIGVRTGAENIGARRPLLGNAGGGKRGARGMLRDKLAVRAARRGRTDARGLAARPCRQDNRPNRQNSACAGSLEAVGQRTANHNAALLRRSVAEANRGAARAVAGKDIARREKKILGKLRAAL